jgi:hypothetical protein
MMKTALCSLAFFILFGSPAFGQMGQYALPPGGQGIEIQSIQSIQHGHRALLLWMINPLKVPRDTPDDPYTCPEYTRGSYYQGPTRVSLVDPQTKKIINTLKIQDPVEDQDTFDIPYRLESGLYYHVAGVPKGKEGKPTIMWLKDYNGDGHAWEFALFDAIACMGLPTTLIGYSEAQDRVIQYPVDLTVTSGEKKSTRVAYWVDYLFSKHPEKPGFWKYAIDYRGRAGTLDAYEVRYLPQAEKFAGRLTSTADAP